MGLNIISIILSSLLSVISIIIAICAYKQGTKQIETSNKQSLFKERLKAYISLNSYFELYELNKNFLKDVESIPTFMFYLLTGNKLLENTQGIMDKPFDKKEQNNFLRATEDLMELSTTITLLWNGEESFVSSRFILEYINILIALYKQHAFICKLEENKSMDLKEFKNKTQQKAEQTGLFGSIAEIEKLSKEIKENNVFSALKEQIRLK